MTGLKWWQKAVFYQIYPRSFADGNGDGIGDFQGIISKLDYLQDLGIDAIWLSPHYPSPQFDCGYDIADYTAVNPEYGTLEEFKQFLNGAHQRGIRIILDLVLNHTSDQHPWFAESRSSRFNPKRNWYIWRDGRDNGPPNNWESRFGGPAWEFDLTTGQYYYHYFFKEQPDLNWRTPEVKQRMFNTAHFWLKLGVDGFRLDAIGTILEDPTLPNHTVKLTQTELRRALQTTSNADKRKYLREQWAAMSQYQRNQPGIHQLLQELRAVVDEYPDCLLVGETDDIAYYGDGDNELHLVFNFPLMLTSRLTPTWVDANQRERLALLPAGAWPCNTLGNHDQPRVSTRFGDGRNDDALARISLVLMLTLRGTPFLYNGEEIGMTDMYLGEIGQFRDMLGVWYYNTAITQLGATSKEAHAQANRIGRDKCRTPMQWTNAPNAGFCPPDVDPWLPANPNYIHGINVADQLKDPDSLLTFYQRILRLRRQTPALIAGEYTPLHQDSKDYLAFLRHSQVDDQTCLVVLNMSEQTHRLSFDLPYFSAHVLFSNHNRDSDTDNVDMFSVAPFETYIAELR